MKYFLSSAALFAAAVCTLVVAGCTDESGSCPSDPSNALDPSGDLFEMRVYNCAASKATVLVNDRPIGEIDAYDQDSYECGLADLGSFPQCTVGTIKVYAGNTESMMVNWTDIAVANSQDGCWVVFSYGYESIRYSLPAGADPFPEGDPVLSSSQYCDMDNMVGFADLNAR